MEKTQAVSFDFTAVSQAFFSTEQLKKISHQTIGIAGCGGLGSNCAMNLVRSGFARFVLIDYDLIEASNLNRQFYFADQVGRPKVAALKENLLRINPQLSITVWQIKIDRINARNLFKECSVIVEAFDRADAKVMLTQQFLSDDRLFVCASGLAGIGNSDRIRIRKLNRSSYMVGDGTSEVSETCRPHSPRVAITAAKQADVVLQWVVQ